ncbi:hypothetical protein BHE74_00030769 [Ensete ventricosum]|uniref:peptidylprolyl isomerase n=1 Tax=Ensete ventricosum TaxID=4639 RepID=A0A426Y695_ENSVE|nr:hypothetical protein B296_00013336 [Ensete ventricosum]RWV82898.1 hypothetical protein GW17_00055560 [Ensete ventricosum]RWW62120.1 hypothetical protein BHE74_00030769 [Ensete ventricosum]RZS18997.1 hypothetical protein BHM03_00051334 [Ensete ventricosum]
MSLVGSDDDHDIVTEGSAFVHNEPAQDHKDLPKVESEMEVLHEKVKKQIIKEGHGQKPPKLSTCFCKCHALLEFLWDITNSAYITTEKAELAGLGIGIASMRSGERALFHVGWELGYGKEGNFSFPNVPPMADLVYEVELIGYDEAKEVRSICLFCFPRQAIAYMGDDFMFQLFGKYRDMALAVKNPCHLNMAACLIKLKRYEEAIGQCTIVSLCRTLVLSEDENNVKALFRRGKARAELGQTDAAREDFEKARKYAPQDKSIVRELHLLAAHDKAVYQKQKEIYKGIFGPRPEPKPMRSNWLVLFWQWLVALVCRLFRIHRSKAD